ncbi:MAG: hypothetical protein AB4911_00280 [Oscillochloridaceae bacterium umkhey_bin13]
MIDERHEPQPALANAAPPPQSYAPQPSYSQPSPAYAPAPASPVDTAARLIRLLAVRAIWAGEQLWRFAEPRLGWLILTSVLMGIIAVLSFLLVLPVLTRALAGPSADPRVSALVPAPAVVNFLQGQQTYDADLMWESFSPELHALLERRDITRTSFAEQVERERLAGQRYRNPQYIGGIPIDNNRMMYFYAIEVSSAQRSRNVSYVFTVDGNGKIVSVE